MEQLINTDRIASSIYRQKHTWNFRGASCSIELQDDIDKLIAQFEEREKISEGKI